MNQPILIPDENIYETSDQHDLYPIVQASPIKINAYTDIRHRKIFISRVYTTLWFQILFTSLFIGLCNQNHNVRLFLLSPIGINLMYLSIFSILVSSCCLFGFYEKIKIYPYNYLYVSFFTVMMSYSLGIVGAMYNPQALLLSGLSTSGIFSGLTLYAFQTKVDYTIYGNIAIILLFGLLFFGILISFFQIQMLQLLYSVGGGT
jgi:FtsH-binding integral membrane protein